jgi:starch synthase
MALPARFDATRIDRREASRVALRARMGLHEEPGTLLFGVVSRLSWQKGLDILQDALPRLIAAGCQLAVLGTGEPAIEQAFRTAAAAHPGRVGCVFAYSEPLAHLMQAGSDALLVPSRFEPCGLTQLYALRYGALPVVARVGGLADTVIDANAMALARGVATGVQFAPTTRGMLEFAIRRTVDLWRDRDTWRAIQQNAMATDVSWRTPARHYARLYRDILAERAGRAAPRTSRLETSTP